MKATLNIATPVMRRLKAARQGRTLSKLVEAALRTFLRSPRSHPKPLQPLPTFKSGGALVDIANREARYDAMEGRLPS